MTMAAFPAVPWTGRRCRNCLPTSGRGGSMWWSSEKARPADAILAWPTSPSSSSSSMRTKSRSSRCPRVLTRRAAWGGSPWTCCSRLPSSSARSRAERIRDKIAASKRKGLWMGGVVPSGYPRPRGPQAVGGRVPRLSSSGASSRATSNSAHCRPCSASCGSWGIPHKIPAAYFGQNHRQCPSDQWPARLYPEKPTLPRRAQSQGKQLPR